MKIYEKIIKNYTVCSNNIFNHNLSLKAIGLYLFLISKPNEWEFTIQGLKQQLKEGEWAIKLAIHELEDTGFLIRRQKKDHGMFSSNEWDITDEPLKSPLVENSPTVNHLASTYIVSTNKVSTKNNIYTPAEKTTTTLHLVAEEIMARWNSEY